MHTERTKEILVDIKELAEAGDKQAMIAFAILCLADAVDSAAGYLADKIDEGNHA